MKIKLGTVWKKLLKETVGVTDKELDFAVVELTKLANSLKELGPHFFLVWKEINFKLKRCKEFESIRRNKKDNDVIRALLKGK